MKMRVVVLASFLGVLLSACSFSSSSVQKEDPLNAEEGFSEPETSEYEMYRKAVQEYFYYRTQAVIQNEIQILWDRYPSLQKDVDESKGINTEQQLVQSLGKNQPFIDANVQMEGWNRMTIKEVNETSVVAFIHGGVEYVRQDFSTAGGERLMKIFLAKEGSGWTVTRTDDYTLSEYKNLVKQKQRS